MELLAVVAIIGLLVGMLLPAVQTARESGRRAACANNLKQIGLAIQAFHAAEGRLPLSSTEYYVHDGNSVEMSQVDMIRRYSSGGGPNSPYTWAAGILPFMEAMSHFQSFRFDRPCWDDLNAAAQSRIVSTYVCPSDPDAANPVMTDRYRAPNSRALGLWYAGSMGAVRVEWSMVFCSAANDAWCNQPWTNVVGVMDPAGPDWRTTKCPVGPFAQAQGNCPSIPTTFNDVRDGFSNTILVGETIPADYTGMYAFSMNRPCATLNIPLNTFAPGALPERSNGFKSRHAGGVTFVFYDGSVRFLDEAIDYRTQAALGSRNRGEVVVLP